MSDKQASLVAYLCHASRCHADVIQICIAHVIVLSCKQVSHICHTNTYHSCHTYVMQVGVIHVIQISVGITHVILMSCKYVSHRCHKSWHNTCHFCAMSNKCHATCVKSNMCHSSRYVAVVKMCCNDVIETNCPCDLVSRQVNLLSRLMSSIGTGDLGIT